MEIKDFLKQAGIFLKDEGINALKSYINEECRSARENQKYNDIITSIVALSDAGTKEEDLYELLYKFWRIDSRELAKEYISLGRYVEWPYGRLKRLLKSMGYDNYSIIKYMKEYDVRKKLESNSKLCMLSDEKLKAEIEK